jgi:hypothetical protein
MGVYLFASAASLAERGVALTQALEEFSAVARKASASVRPMNNWQLIPRTCLTNINLKVFCLEKKIPSCRLCGLCRLLDGLSSVFDL